MSLATLKTKVEQLIEKAQSGGGISGAAKIKMPEAVGFALSEFLVNIYDWSWQPEFYEWIFNLIYNGTDFSQVVDLDDALYFIDNTQGDLADLGIRINIENFNAQNVEYMQSAFYNVDIIESINNVNNKNIILMDMAFMYCHNLHTITNLKLLGNKPNNSNYSGIFAECGNLVNLSLMEGETIELSGSHTNLSTFKTVDVSDCPLLSLESLVGILNAVVNKNTSDNIRVYFGSENIAKLSTEHLAIAAEKRIELV